MTELLSSRKSEEPLSRLAQRPDAARARTEGFESAMATTTRLTLTAEQLRELTGYKRGAEQARWLKENGFKFRLDRLGKPRVDRAHYETKMGCKLGTTGDRIDGGSPNWAALLGA